MTRVHIIETTLRPEFPDPVSADLVNRAHDENLDTADIYRANVFWLKGEFDAETLERIARQLLSDAITERYSVDADIFQGLPGSTIKITFNPGVMDPVEESARKALFELGIEHVEGFKTGLKCLFSGEIKPGQIEAFAGRNLYNKVVQHIVKPNEDLFVKPAPYVFERKLVPIEGLTDKELLDISRRGLLSLNADEMRAIQKYFAEVEHRDPTDVEMETIAQTWSEHCYHKTFRSKYEFNGETIPNLLKSTVMLATTELNLPWCVSVFKDNAGIISFDDDFDLCFKVETHNHPSALEPYGGAGTGIGGVIRDVLGTGLGAKPIANIDVFCFAPPDISREDLPAGVLHPKRIMKGVVSGVRDYGNRMGIPTVNGAVCFHKDFIGNPLVYCGTLGILPRGMHVKEAMPGDYVVAIGGKTGRDGIHGATFSSIELDQKSETTSSGAVQIGNPIEEKRFMDAMLIARDRGLYDAVTDCGAGGFSSAVGEMGSQIGARVYLDRAPLKYEGLTPWEIWVSEAQERMVLSVPPEHWSELKELMDIWNVETTHLGEFTGDKRLQLFYKGEQVADISMEFLHEGIPPTVRKATWKPVEGTDPKLDRLTKGLTPELLLRKVMGHLDVASKEWVIRQYDHEVQGGSTIKPLTGVNDDGPSDAAVIRPVLTSKKGCVIGAGVNVRYGAIDPYKMATASIDEAMRNIVSVGGDPHRTAILDNFSWGSSTDPEQLGKLVMAARACYDSSKTLGVPFISGKDSLNNEYRTDKGLTRIPSTLLISAMSIVEDVDTLITMDAKKPGNILFIVGPTKAHVGGSVLLDLFGESGVSVPEVDLEFSEFLFSRMHEAIMAGLVASCHDLSDGGLGAALSEMCFAGELGCEVDLSKVPMEPDNSLGLGSDDLVALYSETPSRFIVEIKPEDADDFVEAMAGIPLGRIGVLNDKERIVIHDRAGKKYLNESIHELKDAWKSPLAW